MTTGTIVLNLFNKFFESFLQDRGDQRGQAVHGIHLQLLHSDGNEIHINLNSKEHSILFIHYTL